MTVRLKLERDEIKKRRIMPVGSSHLVSLPPEFMREHNLKAGDYVFMTWGDCVTIVTPNLPKRFEKQKDRAELLKLWGRFEAVEKNELLPGQKEKEE